MIHVCALSGLAQTAAEVRPSHLVTLINAGTPVIRPLAIKPTNHLFLAFNDICEPVAGLTCPGPEHIDTLIDFVTGWPREEPILFHCWAGISRSTAAAFITACALRPGEDEVAMARALRQASPSATPNPRLVALADDRLGRDGRMIDAIATIGRGETAYEGRPFRLVL